MASFMFSLWHYIVKIAAQENKSINFGESLLKTFDTSDAKSFCKNKQVNLKNKPKIGNFVEKQAQHALAGRFNKTKTQQENQIKSREGNPKKQTQNEKIFIKHPICLKQ